MIATDAAMSIVIGVVKISVFGLAGVITAQVVAFALLIGIVALPGAFLARSVRRAHAAARPHRDPRRGGAARRGGDGGGGVCAYGHFTTGGIDDRIDSTLPPVLRPKIVPRS